MRDNKVFLLLKTLVLAVTGGLVFYFLHLPLPWMLGPVTILLIWNIFLKSPLYWPAYMRNAGLAVLGYLLGSTFTRDIFWNILHNLPFMFLSTVSIIIFSICASYYISHALDLSFPSILIGNMPGGFSQMVILGEELKHVDTTTVTVMQTLRLIIVMFTVPFITIYGLNDSQSSAQIAAVNQGVEEHIFSYPSYFIYVLVICACIWLAHKLRFPTAFLLGSLIGTAALVLIDVPQPVLPSQFFILAQLCISTYLGLSINPARLTSLKKLGIYSVVAGILLVSFTLILAYFLSVMLSIPLSTTFLSLAPGGIPEMGILGKEIKADISMITSYQLFRLLFILFVVPPILKWWVQKSLEVQKSV